MDHFPVNPETSRELGRLAMKRPDGTWWVLEGVPDHVFDYVERGEDIPMEAFLVTER